jgi:hypothetical protein
MTATIASFTLGGSLSDKLAPRPGPAAKPRWQSSVEEINRARKHSDHGMVARRRRSRRLESICPQLLLPRHRAIA